MVGYSAWDFETLSKEEKTLNRIVAQKWDDGDFVGAIEILKKLLDDRTNTVLFNVELGQTYEYLSQQENDPDKMILAEKYFKIATELEPKSSLLSSLYFHCLWDLDKHIEAIEEMNRFKAVGNPKEYREIEEDYAEEIAEIKSQLQNK